MCQKFIWIIWLLSFICFIHIVSAQNRNLEKDHSAKPKTDSIPRHFDGIYVGMSAGSQNLFGGSFVNGVDVLAQDSRFVTELYAGFRKQFLKRRFLAGIEFQIGFTDGNLKHSEPAKPLFITYKNSFQSGLGLTLGVALGKQRRFLLFAYGNETTRKFDVKISEQNGSYTQQDEQGMLRYGIGLEMQIYKVLNIRASTGRYRVDFGELITNIDVEDKMDFMLGVICQF